MDGVGRQVEKTALSDQAHACAKVPSGAGFSRTPSKFTLDKLHAKSRGLQGSVCAFSAELRPRVRHQEVGKLSLTSSVVGALESS